MKKLLVALVLTMFSISLVGCGSNDGSKDDDSKAGSQVKVIDIQLTNEEYAFGVDKSNPELLEKVNEFIKEANENGTFDEVLNNHFGEGEPQGITSGEVDSSKEQLIVATNAAFEPFEYTKGDKYYGIDMELASLLADKLGVELVISNMDFDSVVLSVGEGKADIGMAGLTITEARKESVNFTDSYYSASQKVVVLESDTRFDECKTVEDVEAILNELSSDAKIRVQTGTTGQFYVEGDADWGFEGFDVEAVGYRSGSLAVQDMINGNIDLVIIDEAPAAAIVEAINALN